MIILGIETSCDETAVALYDSERGLLAHDLFSQLALHQEYGGVVPELAARDHLSKITPLLQKILHQADVTLQEITAVAYTAGPGLIGALMVGAAFARSLAYALKIPALAVNHMEGHLLAPLLEDDKPNLPLIALLVSGGHTQLVQVNTIGDYELLGDTLDDAAGEAFDKVARLLGLPYPGGPAIAKLAQQGNPERFHFPRPMLDRPGLDFSFSGLKTFTQTVLAANTADAQTKADIAYAFQAAVVDALVGKCQRACKQTHITQLVVAGGVSANQVLRNSLQQMINKLQGKVYFPRLEFCTDNAAMIAFAGYQRYLLGVTEDLAITLYPRWPLTELNSN